MAVAQAVGAGCLPIVFAAAGPLEIVETLQFGLAFETVNELEAHMREAIEKYPTESTRERCVARAEAARAVFSLETQRQRLKSLLDRLAPQPAKPAEPLEPTAA